MANAKIGLIGLAVMGANLARNIASRGVPVSVFNRSSETTRKFVEAFGDENLSGYYDMNEFVESIESPKKIIIMVKAGKPVDDVIAQLRPLLSEGDMIIDCGNSFYKDTQRRYSELQPAGISYVGCGVSGGEEGALRGPSIMPGGDVSSFEALREILESIAAEDFSGGKCVAHIGKDGAGHFVKMVHNGIEYAVMQMIAEAYFSLKHLYGLDPESISAIFGRYNAGKLNSYLFEITAKVLLKRDEHDADAFLIDRILDKSGAKGTGKWTSVEGFDRAQSVSTIAEATFMRAISQEKALRTDLCVAYGLQYPKPEMSLEEYVVSLEDTLYSGMLIAYAQGYSLIRTTSIDEGWEVDLAEISRIWQGGCIIRAKVLEFLSRTFSQEKDMLNILQASLIKEEILSSLPKYKKVLSLNLENNVPLPCLSAGLSYLLSMTQDVSGANLIQGLRDFFGAHTYERTDREGIFHTEWE